MSVGEVPRDAVPSGGSDQREQRALDGALVQLHVVADLEAADHVEQRLQRHALGVEQQLLAEVGMSPRSSTRRSPSILPFGVRNAA